MQGGLDPNFTELPPVPHEPTSVTGLRNLDGVLSMARDAPATATSEFSISVGNNPALDEGGARHPDGLGFAAFARVVVGMDVVRRINRLRSNLPTDDGYLTGQLLNPHVRFLQVSRLDVSR